MRLVLSTDECLSWLNETSFKKPIQQMCRSDWSLIISLLIDYHCIPKVTSIMDQFLKGLHIADLLKQYPNLMKPLFVNISTKVDASML